ncbi:MAG: S9 family peptidase [bacterium]|nr:MAG: S9 family peptidase [bacterium]
MESKKYFKRANSSILKILRSKTVFSIIVVLSFLNLCFSAKHLISSDVFSPNYVFKIKTCTNAQINPDGKWIAYTVRAERQPEDDPGGAYSELYLVSVETGDIHPFITGKVNIGSPQWSPDGSKIAFLSNRWNSKGTQVWIIPANGGEAFQLTHSETSVSDFRWHPSGKKIVYLAPFPKNKKEKELEKKGYGFIFYEENLKHRNLYLIDIETGNAEQLTNGVTVWSFEISPDGKTIAASISPKNLIDYRYMFRQIYLLDLNTKKLRLLVKDPWKLGNFAFSPDGTKLTYTAALERKDHQVSQVYVIDVKGGESKNLTVPDFHGHVNWVDWKDNNTLLYRSGEGVYPTFSLVKVAGGKREVILHAQNTGIVFNNPNYTRDFKHFALVSNAPDVPGDVYYWEPGKNLKRLTTLNPWLTDKKLGKQKIIHYNARDGLEIEGLLIYPVDYQNGEKYPLIVVVHGGPESHYSNGWLTSYSRPGQVLSGKGYVVFYPNYRASTGYGVDFALQGYEDAAGKEFDDIADGIDYLINQGIADPERVGLMGGSYGGYAAAWFSSYYTRYVKAVCMFVGISDLISKRGTTDIPYEELYVHSGKKVEEMWDISLKRSPIYWAHQSKTAVLILGGTDDTRVHPSQSLEYYRRLKMNDHPAVRLVQYPGEGHGNRNQPGRIDFLYRTLEWLDWYVKDNKPLDGEIPLLDVSGSYGMGL